MSFHHIMLKFSREIFWLLSKGFFCIFYICLYLNNIFFVFCHPGKFVSTDKYIKS